MTRPDPHSVGRLWLEEGEARTSRTATVAPIAPIDKPYTYAVPPEMTDAVKVGQRVRVPLGRRGRLVDAFCIAVSNEPSRHTLRPIHSLLDDESYLSSALLELGLWISRYYCCPPGPTLAALVPEVVRRKSGFVTVRSARLTRRAEAIANEAIRLGPKSKALLDLLSQAAAPLEVNELLERAKTGASTLRSAVAKGWVEVLTAHQPKPAPRWETARVEPAFSLNPAQEAAVCRISEKIDAARFGVTLLYGVSGSGKTEVYVRVMRRALARGNQVILLVPEIALTTQLVNRLAARFDDVAVVHSGLTGAERSLTWRAIARGERPVVIGTRSAVFAPCPRLGLIVVDEEQEPSFKNLQAPRFHVRDVAIKRAQMSAIPVVLGSATPSLETWHNCRRLEHYERIELPERVAGLPLPEVDVVDMRRYLAPGVDQPTLSAPLLQYLSETLARGEQGLLLINRRGFARLIWCPACRWRLTCPRCNVGMVFHVTRGKDLGTRRGGQGEAVCHYCWSRVPVPQRCPDPSCRMPVQWFGAGTQRVEEELARTFPNARIARADSDTMKRAADYEDVIARFGSRQIDILIGTQMIAKGLHFPHVSFVGVVAADLTGSSADFRTSERLFQLVAQVAGRAGREQAVDPRPECQGQARGRVLVQTLVPDAAAMQAAVRHDFRGFAESELEIRQRLGLPPYARLTRYLLADAHERQVRDAASALAEALRRCIADSHAAGADVLGPRPCVLERLRGQYRYDVWLRAARAEAMQQVLDRFRSAGSMRSKVKKFVVDVDPLSLD